jgi:glucose/arabinose dehydrogenase
LVNDKLANPKLLLDLPATPGPRHNEGAIVLGPDDNLYIPIGDVDGTYQGEESETLTQNFPGGVEPDGRSGIIRITQDENPVPNGGFIENEPTLNLYYAYGIRNSFGIDFDPVTQNYGIQKMDLDMMMKLTWLNQDSIMDGHRYSSFKL